MHRMPRGIASGLSSRGWISALVLLLTLAAPLRADVVVKEKTVSEGLGGFGNGTTATTLTVAGDRSRSEEEFVYTGPLKTLAGKPRSTVSITRLDREVVWSLDPAKKQYTEMTFAEMRQMMAQAGEAMQGGRPQEPRDADMTFTVDVKRTGARQTLAGHACEQAIVTVVGKPAHPKKGEEAGGFTMTMDLWLARDLRANAEVVAYQRRMAEKLGLDPSLRGSAGAAAAMYGNALREMGEKMKGLEGYPLKSTLTIAGPPMSDEQRAQLEKARTDAAQQRAAGKAAREREDRQEQAQDAANLGEAAASGGNVKGALGSFLGKRLGKTVSKHAEERVEASAPSGPPAADGPLFKATTEVLSIASTPAASGAFDVPAGYQKVARERK
jgi:hypothetical protein